MSEFKRWYDEDPVVAKCFQMLENIDESLKRQTATFLTDEILNKPPYSEMIGDKVFELATGETKKRRWYDYDSAVRIVVELLRHSSLDIKKEVALKAITFVEDLGYSYDPKSIAIDE